MVGFGGAVAKGIAKAPMPPLQKAGLIVGAGVAGGVGQIGINYFNKAITGFGTSTNNINNNVSKFLPDSELNPLQGIL
jgi:hypothetical protein